jgi:hypothetical protein
VGSAKLSVEDAGNTGTPQGDGRSSSETRDAGTSDLEPGDDPDSGPVDAAQAFVCPRQHGTCNGEHQCVCAPGYAGELCDALGFVGTGRDGELIVRAPLDLTQDNHEGRSCEDGGDAVSYSVLEFVDASSARVDRAPAQGCLSVGDELLLINLQGSSASTANVGRHESVYVASVDGEVVHFAAPKQGFYGESADDDSQIGLARDQQRVMLQRVPHYTSVLVPAGQVLTAGAWDGERGGVLAFRVQERLIAAGSIDMVARGFVGGAATDATATTGEAGESLSGLGPRARDPNGGGGGGGAGDTLCDTFGFSGAGGGHAEDGEDGASWCSGYAGTRYEGLLPRMGSGGGSGGTDNTLSNNPWGGTGGVGGGVILLSARELYVYGAIDASGGPGEGDTAACPDRESPTSCWDYSGPGGGGAGGYVGLEGVTIDLGTNYVRAVGGEGGTGLLNFAGSGGAGGAGVVHVTSYGAAPLGQSQPEASTEPESP